MQTADLIQSIVDTTLLFREFREKNEEQIMMITDSIVANLHLHRSLQENEFRFILTAGNASTSVPAAADKKTSRTVMPQLRSLNANKRRIYQFILRDKECFHEFHKACKQNFKKKVGKKHPISKELSKELAILTLEVLSNPSISSSCEYEFPNGCCNKGIKCMLNQFYITAVETILTPQIAADAMAAGIASLQTQPDKDDWICKECSNQTTSNNTIINTTQAFINAKQNFAMLTY